MGYLDPDNLRHAASAAGYGAARGWDIGIHDRQFTLYQLSGLIAWARERGALPPALERELGLDVSAQDWPAMIISYVDLRRILERLWHGADKGESLFNHASRVNFASFGLIGLAAMAFPTGEEGIRFCARSFRTAWSAVPESGGNGGLSMLHIPKFHDPEMRSALELFHFVNCLSVSRSRTPGIPIARQVELTHSEGISRQALEDFFGCPVKLGADIAQIHFTREWIQRPTGVPNSDVRSHLLRLCAQVDSAEAPGARTPLQFLSDHIREIRSSEEMARYMGVSRRTLARMLDREGVSYSMLSRAARSLHAQRMLRGREPIREVADVLGFADERSFRRAFREWTGLSPSDYRARHGAGDGPAGLADGRPADTLRPAG